MSWENEGSQLSLDIIQPSLDMMAYGERRNRHRSRDEHYLSVDGSHTLLRLSARVSSCTTPRISTKTSLDQ
jgi:hypothetical protein